MGYLKKEYFEKQSLILENILQSNMLEIVKGQEKISLKISSSFKHTTMILTATNDHGKINLLNLKDRQDIIILLNDNEKNYHPNDSIPNQVFETQEAFLSYAKNNKENKTAINKFTQFLNEISK